MNLVQEWLDVMLTLWIITNDNEYANDTLYYNLWVNN